MDHSRVSKGLVDIHILKIIIFETVFLVRRPTRLAVSAQTRTVGDLTLTATGVLRHEFDALEFIVDLHDIGLVGLVLLQFPDLFFYVQDIVEVQFFLG